MAFRKKSTCFSLLLVFELVSAISINVECGINTRHVKVTYSGKEEKIVEDADRKLFELEYYQLRRYVAAYMGKEPNDVFLKSPTPWGDLYRVYNFQQVKRILEITSAEVTEMTLRPVIVHSQDFENTSKNKIKVNTGISQSIETSIAASWSQSTSTEHSREVQIGFQVTFMTFSSSNRYSYTSTFGQNFEKTESVTVGTNSNMETELNPGQSCSVVLTANRGYLNIKVTYRIYLTGQVAMNYRTRYDGHHFHARSINDVLNRSGKAREKTVTEIIQIGFYTNSSLKVYDKVSGARL